jgi:hypothetical protein
MQTWDAWGGAWGNSWGFSWGFSDAVETGGGSGNTKRQKKKGWANERAALEASLAPPIQKTQVALRQTADRQAIRIASKINAYDIGRIDLDALKVENEALKARLRIKDEYTQTLQDAQQIMAQFIHDEQEALDVLLADFEMDLTLILQQY